MPATEVIEQATLGFGRFTTAWFEYAPPPEDDGDVLIVLVDSKGTPQATDDELALRRQLWKGAPSSGLTAAPRATESGTAAEEEAPEAQRQVEECTRQPTEM